MRATRHLSEASRRHQGGSLARRLLAGSLLVALVSITLLTVVTLVVIDADLGVAGQERESSTTKVIVATLRSTYAAAGGWSESSLEPVGELARTTGLGLEVSAAGHQFLHVTSAGPAGRSQTFPIVVDRRQVGVATVCFPASGLSLGEAKLRHAMGVAVLAASAMAALVALTAAAVASRHLVAPVRSLTVAARRLGQGDLSSRVGPVVAPREIEELARAFDGMASHLERADTLRRAIVADLAHELRTPLAVLQAELEALAVGVEELSPAALSSLEDELSRLSRLVEDLEVLAAAQAAGLSLQRVNVDLASVAAKAARRVKTRFSERALELSMDLVPAMVSADPGRVEQMVVNLLSNAAKFTPLGGQVRLSVEHDSKAARVTVADTGVGIPSQEQARVFERFFRGEAARGVPGSGVGLAVVAELAAAHGASVDIESAPGVGTTITLSFPMQ